MPRTLFALPLLCRRHSGLFRNYAYAESTADLINVKTKCHLKVSDKSQLQVGEKTVRVAGSVKNFGVYFYISLIIRNVDRVRRYDTTDGSRTLEHGLIVSSTKLN